MASEDISLDGTFQLRSRGSGWATVVAGDGDVFNGSAAGARIDYIQNDDGGGAFTIDRVHFRFDVGSNIPSDATIPISSITGLVISSTNFFKLISLVLTLVSFYLQKVLVNYLYHNNHNQHAHGLM